MEQFFKAAHVPNAEKVSLTSMYLMGDAKLWWRTRVGEDLEAGRPQVSEWETLKRELKDQFLPTNVGWLAIESLKGLKHIDSVRDYVKEFSSLMLNIRNMSEEDKLFNFVSGLQGWAQTELRRQGVRDLTAAMAAADCLVDLKMVGAINNKKKNKPNGGMKSKTDGQRTGMATIPESGENVQHTSKWVGCFICRGLHRAKDYPKREKVSALQLDNDSEIRNMETRLNPTQMVNTIQKSNSVFELMYMDVQVNGIGVKALVDTGANHTCVASNVAASLGLKIEASDSVVMSLNGRDHWVKGIIRSCAMEMGDWVSCCNLVVMHLRDFEMIMGMNFLMQAEVSIMPYMRTLTFMEKGTPCTVLSVKNQAMETEDGARLYSSTKHSGGWLKNRDNGI